MREITSHKVNGLNDALTIKVMDEPGSGGANHVYEVEWPDSVVDAPGAGHIGGHSATVKFQNGPIGEAGVNGLSNEALLAIVQDRLEGFQSGEYKNRENALALTHIQEAMHWLHHRTRDRVARGVEGTMQK